MRERIKDFIKVALMLGTCIAGITFLHRLEGRGPSVHATNPPPDTIASPSVFMSKSAKEGLREALEFYDIQQPDIVYAQAQLETGHFKSVGCLEHNNLFGLYSSKHQRYCRFGHWTESVVAYKDWIQRRYKPPNDYYGFLERIHYASDPLYIWKLKQMVKRNEKRRSIGACPSDSPSICTPSIPNRVW